MFDSLNLKQSTLNQHYFSFVRPRIRAFVPRRKNRTTNKPAQQMQHTRGFIVVCTNGWLWSPGRQSMPTSNWSSFICSMLHMGYKVIGYMFAKQSYWYKLRGLLFKFKAILLVQTARAFYWVHIDWPAPGHPMGAGNPTISRKPKPKSWPPASPGPLPAPAPAAPHNKTYFPASKTNKKNIRHMNYRHW